VSLPEVIDLVDPARSNQPSLLAAVGLALYLPLFRFAPRATCGPACRTKGGCVSASISLRLPADCWWFIQIMRSSSGLALLPDDVLAALGRPPGVEVGGAMPEPRLVVRLTRPQAEMLRQWLQALLDDLTQNDDRWLTCLHCIDRVALAIRLSET
jgi:hypothetical protein